MSEKPAVRMTWRNLLFLHWRAEPDAVRALLPDGVELDTFDASAWIGLVPFEMADTRLRGFPPLPGLGRFYECNVRTYVRRAGKPGVWFFSLDAAHLLPVLGGRWLWSLNYIHARFDVTARDGVTDYRLRRRPGWPEGRTAIRWTRGESLPTSQPGSLEHFLTERYWLFTRRHGRIMGGRVAHDPWPLRSATLDRVEDSLVSSAGLSIEGDPIAMMSDEIVVDGFALAEV